MNRNATKINRKEVKVRRTWGFDPTNRVVPNKKAYNKKKERAWRYEG